MMNIKDLDPLKREFEEFIKIMPISKMEFDIQTSSDPLINILYQRLLAADHDVMDPYYQPIIHNMGILGIYSLMDPCYGDIIRWILSGVTIGSINAKPSRLWRINTVYMEKTKCE